MSPIPQVYQTLGMPLAPDSLAPGLVNGFIINIAYKLKVIAKVAAYTIKASESGAHFTNRGATAGVTFTLPALATGLIYTFSVIADFEVLVAAASAGTMVAFHDAAANSVAFTTASEHIGGGFQIVCDGTSWLIMGLLGADSQTITIAT